MSFEKNQLLSAYKYYSIPTLRIVLTNQCNGKCFFCHNEGFINFNDNHMKMNIIENEIIPAINDIGIKKVVFTGGEPTLYDRLSDAVKSVKKSCPNTLVEITTNGLNIDRIIYVEDYLDKITVSVSSLKEDIYLKYTGIDPNSLIKKLKNINHAKKAVSVVITNDNYNEMNKIINYFVLNEFDVKLQSIISNNPITEINENSIIRNLFESYGKFQVRLESTPSLFKLNCKNEIRIKVASLNNWMYDTIYKRKNCISCLHKKHCAERGCSIRVYPNGSVTPCLNSYKVFDSKSVSKNIKNAYEWITK